MRRYIIVFGILLILSIIDLALAAPVLVQDKRQGWVDVIDIPEDAKTALGKRVGADAIEQLWDKWYFEGLWGKPKKSPGAPASSTSTPSGSAPSGSEPSGPDHASTNVIEGPAPGSEPSRLAPSGPDHGSTNVIEGPAPGSEPSGLAPSRPDHGSTNIVERPAPSGPDHGSTNIVEGPAPGSETSGLAPSGSTPSGPDHGSTNVVEGPTPGSEPPGSTLSGPGHGSTSSPPHSLTEQSVASSIGSSDYFDWVPHSPERLKETEALPPVPSETKESQSLLPGSSGAKDLYTIPEHPWSTTDDYGHHGFGYSPAASGLGSDFEDMRPSSPVQSNPNLPDYNYEHTMNWLKELPPTSGWPAGSSADYEYQGVHPSSSQGPISQEELDWHLAMELSNAPPSRPGSPTGFGAAHEYQGVNPSSPQEPMTQAELDWLYAVRLANAPPSRPGSPTGFGALQEPEYQAVGVHPPSWQGPLSPLELDWLHSWRSANAPPSRPGSPTGPITDHEAEGAPLPLSSPEALHPSSPPPEGTLIPGFLPTNTEHEELNRPPSSPVESSDVGRPVNAEDVQAAIYNWKGQEKRPVDPAQEASSLKPVQPEGSSSQPVDQHGPGK